MTDTVNAAPGAVRRAAAGDLQAILAIEQAAFDPARRSSPASLRHALGSRFQQVLVLELDGAVAGYAVIWPYRHSWRVYNLAAHPGYRNRGVGGALLGAVVERARQAGARRVVLESREDPPLLRFYEGRGFVRRRRLPDYYGPGQHAQRLELPLSAPDGAGGLDLA